MNSKTLNWLLNPIQPQEFFDDYFETKPLVLQREDREYYNDLLSLPDIENVLRDAQSGNYAIKLVKNGKTIHQSEYAYLTKVQNIEIKTGLNEKKFFRLFENGATVVFDAFHNNWPRLKSLADDLTQELLTATGYNLYLTPQNSQGFPSHYDTHDVFVIQVHGSKKWRLYHDPLKLPLNTQHYQFYEYKLGAPTMEFDLEQGDLLYIPRGYVHEASANNEISAHISIGLYTSSWTRLLMDFITDLACKDSAFRSAFVTENFRSTNRKASILDELRQRLNKSLTLETLEELFYEKVNSERSKKAFKERALAK